MNTKKVSWLGLVAFVALPLYAADSPSPALPEAPPGPVEQAPTAPAPTPPHLSPSAAGVLKLSGANMGDEVILAYIKNCQSPFNLSANAILRLKEAGVTSPVITAMLTHDGSLASQNPPAPNTSHPSGEQAPVAPAQEQPAAQQQFVGPAMAPAGQTPPPAPAEVVPVAPGPAYYWTPGYWGWNGGWIWIGGCWGLHGYYGWGGHYGYGHYGYYGHGGYYGGHGGGYYGGGHGGGGGYSGGGHGGGGHH